MRLTYGGSFDLKMKKITGTNSNGWSNGNDFHYIPSFCRRFM
jgi:hypothetical protein